MTSAILSFPEEPLASFTCGFGAADISHHTIVGTLRSWLAGVRIVEAIYQSARAGMVIDCQSCHRGKNPASLRGYIALHTSSPAL
jgi:hypothetical protein